MLENKYIKLRPHHLICNLCFRGKGYNEEFIKNFSHIQKKIFNSEATIEIVDGCDDICEKCPQKEFSICGCERRMMDLDEGYLDVLRLKVGQVVTFEELMHRVKTFLTMNHFRAVCKNCSWYSYNICESVIQNLLDE